MRVKCVAEEPTASMQVNQNPNQVSPACCQSPRLNHSRDKGRKDVSTPSNHGSISELLGFQCLFACFCLFTKTFPKWQESSFGLKHHFMRTNHVWVMVVGVLVYIITCKFWKQPYVMRISLSCVREKEPEENTSAQVAFLESQRQRVAEPKMGPRSTVRKSQLLHDGEWNEIMFDGTTQGGPLVHLALACPQPSHRARWWTGEFSV